jgi:hypothetical protein
MKPKLIYIITLVLIMTLFFMNARARDAARDLKRMIGYTIIDASEVKKVVADDYSSKILLLNNGINFKVSLLILPPLPLTDVIIFAKKSQSADFVLIKLLIDNEVYDAFQVNIVE